MHRLHYAWLQRAWVLDARDAHHFPSRLEADAVVALQPGDVAMSVTEHVDA